MIDAAHAPGATPLDPDEAAGLLARHIATQRELNEWEQENILAATRALWTGAPVDPLDEIAVRAVHGRMFDRTWQWAGTYRHSNKNLGVEWQQVPVRVRELVDDARWWRDHTTYEPVELAVRLHHRMVFIHPFANGNGRHARLLADLLLHHLGLPALSWGRASLTEHGDTRERYIAALQRADAGDVTPLLDFAQS